MDYTDIVVDIDIVAFSMAEIVVVLLADSILAVVVVVV